MHFRIRGLPGRNNSHRYFHCPTRNLPRTARCGASPMTATPGYPCRVSLTDLNPGDELILVNYEHHAVDLPYRMRFAIYVRPGDKTFHPPPDGRWMAAP